MPEGAVLLTVHEAAAPLRISRNLAYEVVARGELPAIRLGRVIRVPRAALEYDRGTMHATDYRAKLAGYHRYYDSRQFEDDFGEPPVLLVVAQGDRAEEHVARAARLAARVCGSRLPLILTAEWRFARDPSNARGLPGPSGGRSMDRSPAGHGRTGRALWSAAVGAGLRLKEVNDERRSAVGGDRGCKSCCASRATLPPSW